MKPRETGPDFARLARQCAGAAFGLLPEEEYKKLIGRITKTLETTFRVGIERGASIGLGEPQ
jgi:hypothetical protein